jgi:hypothetical protein
VIAPQRAESSVPHGSNGDDVMRDHHLPLFAVNDHEFLVLELNNRGIGVGADMSMPHNKKVFRIDLTGADDVRDITFAADACQAGKVSKQSTAFFDLAANTLEELGNKVPEKWKVWRSAHSSRMAAI